MTDEFTCVRFRGVRLVGRVRVNECGLATLKGRAVANEMMLGKKRIAVKLR